MTRLYVGGVGGCGKTAVCRLLSSTLGVKHITGSEVMMRTAGVKSRDDLENLPEEIKARLRDTAYEEIYQQNTSLLVEGHFYLTETDANYLTSCVVIETDPEQLRLFRLRDSTRKRSTDKDAIVEEIAAFEGRVASFSKSYRLPICRIKNQGTLDELARGLEALYHLFKDPEIHREREG